MRQDITGLILAGGRARRMGGIDKGLIELAGRPMIEHVVDRLKPQVKSIIINANRNLDRYGLWTDTVIGDSIGHFDGPLAGMASGLEVSDTEFLLSVPCDSPLIAEDLADRMYADVIAARADIAVASDGERLHPVFALLRRAVLPGLICFLREGERKIDKWFERHAVSVVDFSDEPEAFLNVNTIEDGQRLASRYLSDVRA